MSLLASVSLTRPASTIDSWTPMHRRIGHRRRSPTNSVCLKARPRTPQLFGYAPSTARRLLPRTWSWTDLHFHGALRSWLPSRWRSPSSSHTEVITFPSSRSTESDRSSSSPDLPQIVSQVRRPSQMVRVPQLRAEREAAAASMGIDLPTYNLLMELQHRDITPEDYETLRHLDSSTKPKTVSRSRLEARAPCWHVPSDSAPSSAYRLVDQTCSICLEYFKVGDRARRLPCSHVFHASCIDEWLCRNSDLCPEDGLPVLPDAPN